MSGGKTLDFACGVLCTLALLAAALGGRNLFKRKAGENAAEAPPGEQPEAERGGQPEAERGEQPEAAPGTASGNPGAPRTEAVPGEQPGSAEQEEDRVRSRASRESEEAYRDLMNYSAEQAYGVKPGTRDFGTWNETGW